METEIRILEMKDYLLSHQSLARIENRCETCAGNPRIFERDLMSGALRGYEGTFVAYQKGILCGQSADGCTLREKAMRYYGESSLSVFRVPESRDGTISQIQ